MCIKDEQREKIFIFASRMWFFTGKVWFGNGRRNQSPTVEKYQLACFMQNVCLIKNSTSFHPNTEVYLIHNFYSPNTIRNYRS